MKKVVTLLIAVGAVVSLSAASFATIIHVPADQPTIQAGINASSNGDTVLVQPGTYVENINFNGRNIVLGSLFLTTGDTSYISSTIIDGNSTGSVVTFENGESSTAIITGFTIQNGFATYGGGVSCFYSNATITNNTISGNSAGFWGGGIFCKSSNPTIANNTINENSAYYGGGIFCKESNPTITGNTINENSASHGGGGIFCDFSKPVITNNSISGNSADEGGGIFCNYSKPPFANNTISGNSANLGGGLLLHSSSVSLENCIISFSPSGGPILNVDVGCPALTCCNVYGNVGGDWVGCIADQAGINGNFSADPLFCDTANGDFHIFAGSQCAPANNSCGVLIGALGIGCICGDANGDSLVNQDDVAFLQAFYFECGPCPYPYPASDLNCDGSVDIADIVYLAQFLNGTGPEPCCW